GSNPEDLQSTTTHLYFTAEDGMHGRELWRLGTQGHAERITDLFPGTASAKFGNFAAVSETLFFVAAEFREVESEPRLYAVRPDWHYPEPASVVTGAVTLLDDWAAIGDTLLMQLQTVP